MAKAHRKPHVRPSETASRPVRRSLAPDWALLVLSVLGAVLAAYLLLSHQSGHAPVFCSAGSSCDVVQESRWSSLFGLPIALWGVLFYLVVAAVAATGRTAATRWRRVFALGLAGWLVSVYLNVVSWLVLDAVCGWCLVSLGLLTAIVGLAWWRRPPQGPSEGWARWSLVFGMVAVPALALIASSQAGWLSPPADPRLEALALHLDKTGAKYYGAFWCPNCQKQRALFGRSADKLPYVECSPNGRNGALAFECASAGIQNLPTWVIRGQTHVGVIAPEELARHARFPWNAPARQQGESGSQGRVLGGALYNARMSVLSLPPCSGGVALSARWRHG